MSRSTTLVQNPAVLTLKFKNEKFDKKSKKVTQEAGWYYYEKPKTDEEEGKNIMTPMPLKFLWLESAQSVTGYSKTEEASVYSNEILPLNKAYNQELTVKVGKNTLVKGLWRDIKIDVKDAGGKYCIPVYAAMEIEGEYKIVRILISGGSRDVWMNLDKSKFMTHAIISDSINEVEMKTGDTYQAPNFKFVPATPQELEVADELVTKVDDYFKFLNEEKEAVASDSDYND